MLSSTNDLLDKLNIDRLNVAKTLYSKFDKEAESNLSDALINEALEEVYHRGDMVMTGFIALHFLLGLIFAFFYADSARDWYIFWGVGLGTFFIFSVALFFYPKTFFTRALSGIILQAFVLLYIHQTNGIPEVRFFFFTSFTILIVYQDWRALWPSVILLFGQMIFFTYLSNYLTTIIGSQSFLTQEYKTFIINLVPQRIDPESGLSSPDFEKLSFYVGIACLQVGLAGIWAHFLKRQTIGEVLSKQSILTKQLEIEQSNEQLEENVKSKTRELQEALESTQANEEELRQNMEELQATQDEMANQKQQLLENQGRMQTVEKELRERQKKMERAQWLESNLSGFDDIMRLNYDKSLEEFSDIIMLNLAELLNATQGAFYVYEEEGNLLRMKGGYACTPKTVKKAEFLAGEGILGQIIKTKKLVQINDLPDDGPVIESALTKVKSKSLVIVPLLYNEDIQGVIEIAVLNEVEQLHLDFLKRLAKNVASMLQSIRGILRTQRLLATSQEVTAQLQINAKELEKTKHEAEHRALEFQSQFKAIDRSMLVLEMTPEGDITQVNDNFLRLSKYYRHELLKKHHSIFLSEKYINSNEYTRVWNKIRNNEFVESEYECLAKDKSAFWIKANYYSLGVGKNKKVMVLAYDTTTEKEQDRRIMKHLDDLREKEELMKKNIALTKNLREEVEEKAKELQEQMNAINVSTAMIEYDALGTIQYVNDRFLVMMGYEREELIGKSHTVLVEQKLADSMGYQNIWRSLKSNVFHEGEFEFLDKKGNIIWLRGSYYPVSDESGRLIKVMQLVSNITNEILQEEKIKDYLLALERAKVNLLDESREMKAELEAIYATMAVLELNRDGEILNANDKFLKLAKYENGDLIGKHHRVLVPADYAQSKDYQSFWDKLQQNELVEGEFTGVAKDESTFTLRGSYCPVVDQENNITKVIGLVSKINRKRRRTET